MALPGPCFGGLRTTALRPTRVRARLAPRVVAAAALAVAFALFGIVVAAIATVLASSTMPGGPWQHAGAIAAGSVLVQLIAQLTGTGWGQLVRSPSIAMAATIVVPLGLYLVLGVLDRVRPARDWVTPAANAGYLLSGQLSASVWARCLVVVLSWNVGLNALGADRVNRQRAGAAGRNPELG